MKTASLWACAALTIIALLGANSYLQNVEDKADAEYASKQRQIKLQRIAASFDKTLLAGMKP